MLTPALLDDKQSGWIETKARQQPYEWTWKWLFRGLPTGTWESLEADSPVPVSPADDQSPSQQVDYNIMRTLEPEASVKLYLGSWPTETVR